MNKTNALTIALAICLNASVVSAQTLLGAAAEEILAQGEIIASKPTADGFELLVRTDYRLFVCDVTVGVIGLAPPPLAQTMEARCVSQAEGA